MALSQSLVRLIEAQSRERDFARVRRVTVALGCLGHVDAQALRFCFDVVTRRTVAEGAELIFVDRPGTLTCLDCGATGPASEHLAVCAACGSGNVRVEGGDRVTLTEMEVD